jgi:two-component system OmpR family response regulator
MGLGFTGDSWTGGIVRSVKVLLLEDDVRLSGLISRALRRDGNAVDSVGTVEDARWLAAESVHDVLVLDVMLPDGDGFGLCRDLRGAGNWTPVLLLTARDAIDDRVRGLDVGADDYLVKPFAIAELFARLRALVRRGAIQRPNVLESGDLRLDPATREVTVGGAPAAFAGREFALLEYFLRHENEVLTRSRILDEVWDWAFEGTPRIVDVYVRILRARLGRSRGRPRIETIRGVGYALRSPASVPPGSPEPAAALPRRVDDANSR